MILGNWATSRREAKPERSVVSNGVSLKKLFVNKYKRLDKRGIRGFPEQII
jgi:hypothetical protein